MPSRSIRRAYRDPLDQIWLATAARIGLAVVRDAEVFASSDGRGTLRIGTPETLDPDDSLAQMIFHELCHALVEGPNAFAHADWGLDNRTERDVPRERACLRLQAALATRFGLRQFLAQTTDARPEYDGFPPDPLTPVDLEEVRLAEAALARVNAPPFSPHLLDALAATARIVDAARPFSSALPEDALPSIYE